MKNSKFRACASWRTRAKNVNIPLNYPIDYSVLQIHTYIISFLVPGCDNVALVGNGFCNDETNNPDCNYDGGDCCVVNANTNACSECACHFLETCAAGYHPLVGNGFCNDDTNIAECDYDGEDCCGYCVITEHCKDCACLGSDEITNPLVGNSQCNDETNNLNCNYDGGDCCGYSINSEHCTECTCFHQETCLAGVTHAFVGDGVCNDETNIEECNYDSGDCCGNSINSEHCTECTCFHQETCLAGVHPLVGDSVCNDEKNIAECDYDGGDCCVNVNTDSCSDCNCLASGVITSPGFPGNYDNNLDLTWLIQVPISQRIEINFLSFDVEYGSSCG